MLNNWATSFSHYKNRVFRWFLVLSYQFVFFFCFQLFFSFLKMAFFKKGVQKLGFPIFSVLSYFFENSLFLGLLKHYKNRGFSWFEVFLLLKEKKIGKKNDNWNLWIWFFFVQKWPFCDAHLLSKQKGPETPIFIVFGGWAVFGPRCQKRKNLKSHPKTKRKNDW